MFSFRLLVLAVFCALLIQGLSAKKDKDKKKDKKDKGKTEDDSDIDKLTDMVEALEARVDEIAAGGGDGGSSCPGNNVHFFFHGDDHDEHKHMDGDHHVHIDLHLDGHGHGHDDDGVHEAHCEMVGTSGFVHIVQSDNDRHASFMFDLSNLGKGMADYKVHVHQYGDLSDDCNKLGGHYDPVNANVDVGDLGTFSTDKNGAVAGLWKNDTHLNLFGDHSIIGRGIIVHDSTGANVACCVIGIASGSHEHDDHSHDNEDSHETHAHHAHAHHGHAHGRR